MRYFLTCAYEGTNYSGWQRQKNGLSIQEVLERELFQILQKNISLVSASRTDAGVHALCQCTHFDCEKPFDPNRLLHSLNCLLPSDIRILSILPVKKTFHARHSALGKIYHYHLHTRKDPFLQRSSTFIFEKLDLALLKEAMPYFLGTKDFSSFANHGYEEEKKPIRTLKKLDFFEEGHRLRLEFEGNGFLYKMVRNITGTLLDIATKKIPLSDLSKIFLDKDRKKAGRCAPPQGLFLVKIFYSESQFLGIFANEEK